MSDMLSQEEIEALLSSLQEQDSFIPPAADSSAGGRPAGPSASIASTTSRKPVRNAIAYEVYDFRRPDKFSKEQLKTLQMLHETFARHAATGLSAYLRSPVNIDLISLEQVPFDEYLRSINNSVFTIMSLSPLAGQSVLEMEFDIVLSMIDRLLGGPGRALRRTVLTDIERPLVRQMVERLFGGLKSAWEQIVLVNPSIEGMETTAQFVQIAPPNDIVVTILFEVRIGENRGAMSLCIPYLVLKPIAGKLSAQKWFVSSSKRANPANKRALTQQVRNTKIDCTVCLGDTKISVREFMDLKPGDTLRLDQEQANPLSMLVGKSPKFVGFPAVSGRKMVFTISNIVTQD